MSNVTVAQILELAQRHLSAGDLQKAEQAYRQMLAHDPEQPNALYGLGIVAYQAGHPQAAADLIAHAARIAPTSEAFSNLGFILRSLGKIDAAIAACEQAVRLNPNFPEAQNNLGFALEGAHRANDAIAAYSTAGRLKPYSALPWQNLGRLFRSQNRPDEAVQALRRAMEITGPDAIALNDLGVTLQANHELDEAAARLRESIRLTSTIPEVHNNLANVLHDIGRIDEAIAGYREAIRLRPEFAVAHSNLLYAMHFDPACDPAALLQEHRKWAALHAEPLTNAAPPHITERPAARRLRIAYVSGDLHDHPVGRFLLPILQHHDRERFDVICYYDGRVTDAVNTQLRAASDAWHFTGSLSDADLANLIRGHRIDILVDLAVHAPGNRLLVFARKPAPIQVTYLGYPGTTGMSAMDYRISDPYLDPPGESDSFYSEQSIRPAASYWCYTPPADAPDVAELPARQSNYVTFGCLNNFAKTNRPLLNTWAEILRGTSGSRLLLHAHPGTHCGEVTSIFQSNGVDPARLEFVGSQPMSEYLQTYGRIDLALDPFPYHGGTTTCDAFWMGVPVISLAGRLAVHRAGVSLLNNVGLPELAANTREEYVAIATRLAATLARLDEIRRTLRERMRQSPLCDAGAFTRGLENILEKCVSNRG